MAPRNLKEGRAEAEVKRHESIDEKYSVCEKARGIVGCPEG